MFKRWREGKKQRQQAEALYAHAVAAARRPSLYERYGVPDTLDGRFDAVLLHVFLLVDALAAKGPGGMALQRTVQEVMVEDLDRSVREAGVGDLSVGKQVTTMASACRGRMIAYAEAAAEEDPAVLATALARNVYRLDAHPAAPALAAYVQDRRNRLAELSVEDLVADGGLPDPDRVPPAEPSRPSPAGAGGADQKGSDDDQ